MSDLTAIIGLEVHIQLATQSKIFSSSATETGQAPNSLTDPVTLGLPGVLPVLNKAVVDYAIKLGLATNCKIREKSIFARKHYTYPDLPKGYQISQHDKPTCYEGWLNIRVNKQSKKIGITRIQLEEDTGKNIHLANEPFSLIDLNRAGVPLLEIVSEPDMRLPEEAGAYLRILHQLVKYLNICNGNMEEGNFRCDANVSVMQANAQEFGTRVEIKNLNSFKHVEKALAFEIEQQKKLIEQGVTIIQETKLWDEVNEVTKSMRSKEYSADYRFFPEPDLLPLIIDENWIANIKDNMPELPSQTFERLVDTYKLDEYSAELLISDKYVADYFEKALTSHYNPNGISNWITTELFGRLNKESMEFLDCPVSPKSIAILVKLIDTGIISGKIAKTVFDIMWRTGKDPQSIVKEQNLIQISDNIFIQEIIDSVLKQNPTQLQTYKAGKVQLFSYFVGQAMKASNDKVNPELLNEMLKKTLEQ
ncbi:MAG: Asp-tRNA(Asn)/Glu-tRNA(Gln) amidotransferase subunit GatB [Deltaproteobacteria bacterium]|jgi:aspartyl-tRNA(Asn)/glutamyl-tRNA(Gln) amidotransferase subunit B|nr:Asp-tRNA(Asn)/Glu-tRNA(Gln) amidotransferase subunit GatB [Deltaproteobacteria bacterium]